VYYVALDQKSVSSAAIEKKAGREERRSTRMELGRRLPGRKKNWGLRNEMATLKIREKRNEKEEQLVGHITKKGGPKKGFQKVIKQGKRQLTYKKLNWFLG